MTREKNSKKKKTKTKKTGEFFFWISNTKSPHQEVLFDANFVLSTALLSSTRQREEEEEEEEEHVLCCFYIRTLKQSASVLHF